MCWFLIISHTRIFQGLLGSYEFECMEGKWGYGTSQLLQCQEIQAEIEKPFH